MGKARRLTNRIEEECITAATELNRNSANSKKLSRQKENAGTDW